MLRGKVTAIRHKEIVNGSAYDQWNARKSIRYDSTKKIRLEKN
jgi:hypothetical protein